MFAWLINVFFVRKRSEINPHVKFFIFIKSENKMSSLGVILVRIIFSYG